KILAPGSACPVVIASHLQDRKRPPPRPNPLATLKLSAQPRRLIPPSPRLEPRPVSAAMFFPPALEAHAPLRPPRRARHSLRSASASPETALRAPGCASAAARPILS